MDIGRALTYFTEDERWVEKTAIGTGLFLVSSLLSVVLIGLLGFFILFGYMVRLVQNVRDGVQPALPEWNQWGDDLVRGVKLACVYVVWALPIIFVSVPLSIFGAILDESFRYGDDVMGLFLLCSFCLTFLVAIAYAVLQPGFTIAFARKEQISDGLQASEIWNWTRDNIGNVVIVAILTGHCQRHNLGGRQHHRHDIVRRRPGGHSAAFATGHLLCPEPSIRSAGAPCRRRGCQRRVRLAAANGVRA